MEQEAAGVTSVKRDAIVQAAAAVFARYGFHKTAMSDIIRASGVSRATVYKYFPAKGDVFRAVIWREKKDAIAEIGRAVAAEETARERLKAALRTSLRVLHEKANLYRLAMHSLSEVFPRWMEGEEEVRARTQEVREILTAVLRDGVASGELVVGDVELAAEAFHTVFRGLMFGSFVGLDARPAGELSEAVVDMFMDGLATKGEA